MKRRIEPLLVFVNLLAAASVSQAAIYSAPLTGSSEAPPNASPATGNAIVDFDPQAHTIRIDVAFGGLLSTTTAAHIHCCVVPPGTAGVATPLPTFPGFPLGVATGTYSSLFNTLSPATWNPAFINANGGTAAGAEAALANGLAAGTSYFNIHTTAFPGGEIRGFLTEGTAGQVPEPGGVALLGIAAAAWLITRRRAGCSHPLKRTGF